MKIIRMKAQNIKRLKAVEITPDGNVVKLTGANNQGKTSVLDAIEYALAGKRSIPSRPLRDGEKKGFSEVETEDFIVTRRFTKNGSTLTVTSKEGLKYPTPQKFLDNLVGRLSFDPLEFARMNPTERMDALVDLAGIREKIEAWEAAKVDHNARAREAARNHDIAEQSLDVFISEHKPLLTGDPPAERLDEDEADKARAAYVEAQHDMLKLESEATTALSEVESQERQIDRLKQALNDALQLQSEAAAREAELGVRAAQARQRFEKMSDPGTALQRIQENNRRYDAFLAKASREERLVLREAELDKAKAAVQGHREKRLAIFEDAVLPVKGLAIGDGDVTFRDHPFDQLSSSLQLKVSLAMAMAANPELRVIRISDGSLLDTESLATIEKMAQKKDYQVWIEIVDETGKVGFVIEDGEIVV